MQKQKKLDRDKIMRRIEERWTPKPKSKPQKTASRELKSNSNINIPSGSLNA